MAEASGRLLSTERDAGEWKRLHWRHARREHVRARLPHDLLQWTRAESRRPDASAEGGERDRSAVSSHDMQSRVPVERRAGEVLDAAGYWIVSAH